MQVSYTKNYIKIDFLQILSILLGFVSMFIVVPYLSSDQTTYGIYSVCISVTIFLSYAYLYFLGAGQKYAAVYAVIKGVLINVPRYLASYLGKYNVYVNCMFPGGVADGKNPSFVKRYNDKSFLKRMGCP